MEATYNCEMSVTTPPTAQNRNPPESSLRTHHASSRLHLIQRHINSVDKEKNELCTLLVEEREIWLQKTLHCSS